jgi:hypothetical protein
MTRDFVSGNYPSHLFFRSPSGNGEIARNNIVLKIERHVDLQNLKTKRARARLRVEGLWTGYVQNWDIGEDPAEQSVTDMLDRAEV